MKRTLLLIDPTTLADESSEIKSVGRSIFIAGRDTNDGEVTSAGRVTDGTFYGEMEFLERHVGARWLQSER